jgi:hypothetical protein
MNLRLAVSTVFVASLACACGPSAMPEGVALASMGGTGFRTTKTPEKTLKKGSSTLTTSFDVAQSDDEVRFEFRIVNGTAKSVEVNFPSGQAYDFVVVDSVGREVWRWAEGRIFTQSVQNKLLGKGESITVSEKWPDAKPGRFTAIAVLRSTNFPMEAKVAFEHR